MAKPMKALDVQAIVSESLNEIFNKEYSKFQRRHEEQIGYRLEQCGKMWRVKYTEAWGVAEYKTDFLTYKEAQALLVIFKSGEDDGNS